MPYPVAVFDIAVQACRLLEVTGISSLDDAGDLARAMREQYPVARDRALEAADWSFASVLAALPQAVPEPTVATDADLPYLYALPGDLLVIREVGTGLVQWRRDREGIRADEPAPLRLRYTGAIVDEARLPAEFRTAVGFVLALALAPKWLGTQSKTAALEDRGARALKQAMQNHAREASEARYDGQSHHDDWATGARW